MSTDLVQQKAKTLAALLEVSKKQIEAALRSLVVQFRFDGLQTVEAPLGGASKA